MRQKDLRAGPRRRDVPELLPVAEARQPPRAAAAQAAAVGPAAAHPAQESPRQTAQPGGAESAAPLPSVLIGAGEKKLDIKGKKKNLLMCFTALQHVVLQEKRAPGTD